LEFFGVAGRNDRKLSVTPIDGADPRSVEGFYRNLGFHVLSGSMTWDHLRLFGQLGHPCQLLVTLEGTGHYVLSDGVDRSRIRLMDPLSESKYFLRRDKFESCWSAIDDRFGVSYHQFGISVWR
jgi:hypothetical protein